MNRYKRSAARSEHQTLNNTDDGIYFVTDSASNPKIPNIISRNQSRRSISSNNNNSAAVNMSTAACLSQNQHQQIVVEENVVPLQEPQLGPDIVVTDGEEVQELPLHQEVTTDQQVQIVQDPQDENSGLMYFLLEDGTLAQIDTSTGTPWLNNSNIELQFDGQQQQQIVGEECTMDQQEMVKDLCPPPENEMMVVDSEIKPEELALEQLTETGIEQQHIDSELQQVVEPISQLVQQTVLDSEQQHQEESNFGHQAKQNAASVLNRQQLLDLSSLDTQPLNLEDLEEHQQQQQHEQNNGLGEELLGHHHHALDSSNVITGGEGEQEQINLQQVLSGSQLQQQQELNLNKENDNVLNTNMEAAPDLIQQDDVSGKEETALEAHQKEPGPSLLLEGTSEIKRDNEKEVEAMEHDEEKQQETEELINSTQEQLLLEPVDKINEHQQQQQQQHEELNQNNPDQESYFLLQINGQTLLLPMSSLSDQNTILDENNQEINLAEQFGIVNPNQCESSHMPDIASNNASDHSSSFIQPIANSVPSNDDASTVNLTAGEDSRPKPYRFVLPTPANTDSNLEPFRAKVEGNSSAAVTTTTTTTTAAHQQQQQSTCQSDIHEDATEQPPIKRFKPGQEEVKTSEPMRKSFVNVRPGTKIVPRSTTAAGPKAKIGNTCIFRCGACHKLYSTKELALAHMVEVHKADPRTTRTEFRSLESTPKHHKCSKCGNLYQSQELLHKHICNRAAYTSAASGSHNEKSRSIATTSLGTSTTTAFARFDGSSTMKTKLNQLEMEKKSESPVEKTIKSTQQSSSIYSPTTTTVAAVPERKCYSKNNTTLSLPKSAVSVAVEKQTTTTPGLVQNSSKLRTTPTTQLNYPPDLTCCERTFVSLYYYLQHRLIHSREANSSEPWQCEVCQVEFAAKQELLAHFFAHNSEYTPPRKRKSKPKAQSAAPTSSSGAGKVKQTTNEREQNNLNDKNQISSNVTAQQTTNKRGRGRPPKVKPSDDDDSSTTPSNIKVKVENEKPQEKKREKQVIPKSASRGGRKRGRGRPRKSSKDDRPVEKNLNIKSETPVVEKRKPGRPSLKKDQNSAATVTPKKRGRKPKATSLPETEGETESNSAVQMASETTGVSRRSLRNVTTTAAALTNGHNKETIAEGEESSNSSPRNKLRGTRLRCSTQNSNDTSTIVEAEEKETVTSNDIKEEPEENSVNSTPTTGRSDSIRGADSTASTVSEDDEVVDEPPVKKSTVKGPTTTSRRHTDELMRMRTPASQKRVQDSFVEIFKRVKRNSAEDSHIINRNGGVGSSKPK